MLFVLTNNAGRKFQEVTNRARTETVTWEVVRDRLVDFEKANVGAGDETAEKTIRAMQAKTQVLEKKVADFAKSGAGAASSSNLPPLQDDGFEFPPHSQEEKAFFSGESNQFKGKCHSCGKFGHTRRYCRNPDSKGKGKRDKGKGKGGGGKKKGWPKKNDEKNSWEEPWWKKKKENP